MTIFIIDYLIVGFLKYVSLLSIHRYIYHTAAYAIVHFDTGGSDTH